MALGEQIRKYRLALGLKLEHLAELSEVAPGTISALTVRKSDRSKYVSAIAKGFGLSVDELLDTSQNYLLKSFNYVDKHRPTGWEPTKSLILQVESLKIGTTAREPQPEYINAEKKNGSAIIWPFRLVSYERISNIKNYYATEDLPNAIEEIDKHLDILVARWESEMKQAKRSAA